MHTPHDLRHTWASWHYALHRDLLRLKQDGGWSSVVLVERYAHLVPEGHEDAIRRLWGDWHAVGTAPVMRAQTGQNPNVFKYFRAARRSGSALTKGVLYH